jgi:hypothetical protein
MKTATDTEVHVGFRLPASLRDEADRLAASRGETRSHLLRGLLSAAIRRARQPVRQAAAPEQPPRRAGA